MQVLRAVAAIAVVLSHLVGDIASHGGPTLFSRYYAGAAGVDLFFVISGFVMVYAARDLFGTPRGCAVFLRRRLVRIVPLYWMATGVYALMQIGQGKWGVVRPDRVAESLVFWPFTGADGLHLPVYSIGWTLNQEMFFYAVFALGLTLRRRLALAAIVAGLVMLVALGAAVALPGPLRFWSRPILIDFLLGIGLGSAYLAGWRLPARAAAAARLLAAALFVAGMIVDYNALPDTPESFPRWIAWGLPAALLFAGTVLRDGGSRPVRRATLALGDASYALYLIHPLIIIALRPLLPLLLSCLGQGPLGSVMAGVLVLLVTLAAILAGTLAVHRWVERPLMAWLGAARRRPAAAGRRRENPPRFTPDDTLPKAGRVTSPPDRRRP